MLDTSYAILYTSLKQLRDLLAINWAGEISVRDATLEVCSETGGAIAPVGWHHLAPPIILSIF